MWFRIRRVNSFASLKNKVIYGSRLLQSLVGSEVCRLKHLWADPDLNRTRSAASSLSPIPRNVPC